MTGLTAADTRGRCLQVASAVAAACGLDDADVDADTWLCADLGLDWGDLPVILAEPRPPPSRPVDAAEVLTRLASLGDRALSRLTVAALAGLLDPEFGW